MNTAAMDEAIESELLAARTLPFARDEAGWVDAYVGAASRLDPAARPSALTGAARSAWRSHGWAHPAVVAHLAHELAITLD
jgi:hypothetical protein